MDTPQISLIKPFWEACHYEFTCPRCNTTVRCDTPPPRFQACARCLAVQHSTLSTAQPTPTPSNIVSLAAARAKRAGENDWTCDDCSSPGETE